MISQFPKVKITKGVENMSRNYNGLYSAVPMAVFFLDEDRNEWSDLSSVHSLGSHETRGSDVLSDGSTSGGDLSTDAATSDDEYDLDDSFIVDMNDTSGEGSYVDDDESDDTFVSANYIHVLDEGSEDAYRSASDVDEEMSEG